MENPLFRHYGRLCEGCFDSNLESDRPFAFFSDQIVGSQATQIADQKYRPLSHYADPDQLTKVQKSAEKLRAALLLEHNNAGGSSQPLMRQKFVVFQKGLANSSEAMLAENPFYELTILIYQLNLATIKRGFAAEQKEASLNLPQAMKVTRSLSFLWGRDGSMIRLKEKLFETFGKIFSLGKIILGLLLFVGSTLTTAKGVNDLVQLDGFVAIFGDFFLGEPHETFRLLLSLTVGVVLSSIILDFKDRLFQGVAETGKVFAGFLDAFKRFPRWMALSIIFSMASIWTNYDGIVLLFSKTQDLSYQSKIIQKRVDRALGDPNNINPDNPDSLADLRGLMEAKINKSTKQFQQVVKDERLGVASSGIARKGPRYWSKYYIINGGYQAGKNDVVRSLGKAKQFYRKFDIMLQRSNLDLDTPLDTKLRRVLKQYNESSAQMRHDVHKRMDELTTKMTLQSYSVAGLNALFNLEAYHVNHSVGEVVALLEKNKQDFASAANKIDQITQAHIAILREMDRVGIPNNTEYTIDVRIDIPRVDAIEELNQSKIPMAKRRSIIELKELLLERYGAIIGGSILFGILFIAVFMDLSDPIFYSTMVARWGRRDRRFLQENIKRFQSWEEEYIQIIRLFLTRPDVRVALPQLTCPKTLTLHWLYHQYLESLAPFVKDYARYTSREKFRFWFTGLFSTTRIRYAEVYNARQSVTRKILADSGPLITPLLNRLYGNLFNNFSIGNDHFAPLFARVSREMTNNEELFNNAITNISEIIDELQPVVPDTKKTGRDSRLHHKILARLHTGHGVLRILAKDSKLSNLYYLIFQKPIARSAFQFSQTRNNWMVDQAVLHKKSLSFINSLTPFVPALTSLLSEQLPALKKDILFPLLTALDEIPYNHELKRVLKIQEQYDECIEFEKELLSILGMSRSKGLRMSHGLFKNILQNAVNDEIPAVFLTQEKTISAFSLKLEQLESRLKTVHAVIVKLTNERKPTISSLTKIHTDYLRPVSSILEKLYNSELIEEAVGLKNMRRELSTLDKFMGSIWGAGNKRSTATDATTNQKDRVENSKTGGGMEMLLAQFSSGQQSSGLSLLQLALDLEERLAATKKMVESKIFLLTFLDKSINKTKTMIQESFQFVANILIQESQLNKRAASLQAGDKERLYFIGDHQLFLQSVPLFLETSRSQLFSSSNIGKFIETGDSNPMRTLESQVFKIHNFLESSLAFLHGERSINGIIAPLDLMEDSSLLQSSTAKDH